VVQYQSYCVIDLADRTEIAVQFAASPGLKRLGLKQGPLAGAPALG
jgi:hypothetical protein